MITIPDKRMNTVTPLKWTYEGHVDVSEGFHISNGLEDNSEITFDYEQAVGGIAFIETSSVVGDGPVEITVIFSGTYAGLQKDTGEHTISFIETLLILSRRWPLLPVLQCNGYVPSSYSCLRAIYKPNHDRTAFRPTIPKISAGDAQDTEFLTLHIVHWLQAYSASESHH